jgi:hypothetical protein
MGPQVQVCGQSIESRMQVCLNSFLSHRSIAVISLLLANFVVFNATQLTPDPDGGGDGDTIWGQSGQTTLWPSIVLLCVATISTLLSIGTYYGIKLC